MEIELNDICLIIDLDGFFFGGQHYMRELGFAELSTPKFEYGSMRFNLKPFTRYIQHKDKQTIGYCENVLGVLKLSPSKKEKAKGLYQLQDLKRLVRNLYRKYKTPDKVFVGYKGGHLERDLLEELDIPYINLELFGCPKYEKLFHDPTLIDCGFHSHRKNRINHCPKLECKAFAVWVQEKMSAPVENPDAAYKNPDTSTINTTTADENPNTTTAEPEKMWKIVEYDLWDEASSVQKKWRIIPPEELDLYWNDDIY